MSNMHKVHASNLGHLSFTIFKTGKMQNSRPMAAI